MTLIKLLRFLVAYYRENQGWNTSIAVGSALMNIMT